MIYIAQEASSISQPSVQNLLTFIGFNLTIATLFFALVYSYSKNLLERVHKLTENDRLLQDPDKKTEASKVCAYFYSVDLITFSALSLLVFSTIFASFCVLEILRLTSIQNRQCFTFILLLGYVCFTLYYMFRFRRVRKNWSPAGKIFWFVLVLELLMIGVFIFLNFAFNFMYLITLTIIVVAAHIALCLIVAVKYTPLSVLIELWGLPILHRKENKLETNNKEN